jgi:hypothetical protein
MTPFLNSRHAGSSIHPPSCTAVVLQVLREAAECEGLDVREPTDDQVAAWWVLLGPSSEGARLSAVQLKHQHHWTTLSMLLLCGVQV